MERHIDPKLVVIILHEGLKGKPVAEICRGFDITEAEYYEWRRRLIILQPQTSFIGARVEKPCIYEN